MKFSAWESTIEVFWGPETPPCAWGSDLGPLLASGPQEDIGGAFITSDLAPSIGRCLGLWGAHDHSVE